MRIRGILMTTCALGCLLAQARAPAAEPTPDVNAERPRVGLVLSGGGARGAAHIGVIRALEKMHVPIDAVAGTSMGAVVGGLYAAGLTGDEIARVFDALDWPDLLRDRAPRKDLVYRRKQADRGFLASGGLGVRADDGVVLPLGLVQGQKITQVLRNSTMRVADVQDFDRLPTPFRALATDLETGEPVVLRSGDLATVLRASMAAPGVFAPVEIGGRMLVDGGLIDNLPVNLAREMGVDVVIAVDVSFPLARRSGLESPLDVTNQMIAIMVRRGTHDSLAALRPGDVLVQPELGRMTAIDFARMPQVIEAGAAAVTRQSSLLGGLALPEEKYAAYAASRVLAPDPAVQVAFVRPAPRSETDARRIEAVFGPFAGQPLNTKAVQREAYHQYGLDQFEAVDYRIVRDQGERGLEVDLRRKSWGPNFLRVGMSIESDYEGGTVANAGAQLLMTGVNSLDGELLLDGQLGEDPHFAAELFQPLSYTTDFFVAPGIRYALETLQIVQDGRRVAQYRNRETDASLALGAELSNWGEVRAGVRFGNGSSRVMIGEPIVPGEDFDIGAAFVRFGYDRLDSVYFPKHGQAFQASWLSESESLGASANADIVEGSWLMARTRGRNTLVLSLDGGSALDDRVVSPQELFTLGGFLNLSGLPPDALIGTQYGIVRAIAYRRVSRGGTGLFEFPAYIGASFEAGNVWQNSDEVDLGRLKTGGSLFLGAETPFGPLYLAGGFAEGDAAFYLILGRTF